MPEYQPHLTNSELELDPVLELGHTPEGDDRISLRYGDIWLPYQRVVSFVKHELTPVQEQTNRSNKRLPADFDITLIGHDDLVMIGYQLYSGFDIVSRLYQQTTIELLMGSGAIRPHGQKSQPKPANFGFWGTRSAVTLWTATVIIAGFVHLIVYGTLGQMFIDVSSRAALIATFPVGSLVASGGLTMLCAKLRDQKTQGVAYFLWAATLWSCLWAGFGAIAALALCFKLA